MARRFRSRRYRPRSARRIRFRKSSLKRIKKDILKCNFPTKVKFMGLTERKVMFLTYQQDLSFTLNTETDITKPDNGIHDHSMYLIPTTAENYESIVKETGTALRKPNWDKMCVLGIYIKIQPVANTFDGADAEKKIYPVQCFYAMDSCPIGSVLAYDDGIRSYKQLFTFNSNEAFTIYLPAPTTMAFNDAVVHRSKTWWSLATLKSGKAVDYIKLADMEEEQYNEDVNDDNDADDDIIGAADDANTGSGYMFHCGRLAFHTKGKADFNVTVNFKVALKG